MASTPTSPPDAELLIATGCAHCPVVLEGLSQLIKQGQIGELRITNIVQQPQRARELGVRSVPWLRLGPFILEGLHSPTELQQWAGRAGSIEGMGEYMQQQLTQGKFDSIESLLHQQPRWLPALIPLLENKDTAMQVRFGIDALLEALAQDSDFSPLIEPLGQLSQHPRPALRNDALHYLALSNDARALPFVKARLEDENEEVREAAQEALALLSDHAG